MGRVPVADKCTLAACPVGLFSAEDGELCLKTEYGNNEGRIDAYIVSSGEFFWGAAPQTIASQRAQMVTPLDAGQLRTAADTAQALRHVGAIARIFATSAVDLRAETYKAGFTDLADYCEKWANIDRSPEEQA